MTSESIAQKLQGLHIRLERAKDRAIGLERRLTAEKGKIARLEAKIKKYGVYKSYYERDVK